MKVLNQNPADLISRGATISELKLNSIWWHGPEWMQQKVEKWPIQPQIFETNDQEVQKEVEKHSLHFKI